MCSGPMALIVGDKSIRFTYHNENEMRYSNRTTKKCWEGDIEDGMALVVVPCFARRVRLGLEARESHLGIAHCASFSGLLHSTCSSLPILLGIVRVGESHSLTKT